MWSLRLSSVPYRDYSLLCCKVQKRFMKTADVLIAFFFHYPPFTLRTSVLFTYVEVPHDDCYSKDGVATIVEEQLIFSLAAALSCQEKKRLLSWVLCFFLPHFFNDILSIYMDVSVDNWCDKVHGDRWFLPENIHV